MYSNKFWKKSYDKGIADIPEKEYTQVYPDFIRPIFKEFPNQLALEFLGIEFLYSELDSLSNQFANMLIENGFKVGDIVGLNLPNTPQYVIAWLGSLKAGCAVSGVSPLLSAEQIKYQVNDLGASGKKVALVTLDAIFAGHLVKIADDMPKLKLVIATNVADFLPKIKQVLGKLLGKVPKGKVTPTLAGIPVKMFMDIMATQSTDLPSVKLTPKDVACVMYTGGTTGPPKGAVLTHSNIMAIQKILEVWLGWQDQRGKGCACSGFPFFHIAGLTFCMTCTAFGWTQLLIPNPRDTNHMAKVMDKYSPTVLVNVPSLYFLLLKNEKFKSLDHSKVNNCFSAAAPFPAEAAAELEAVVGKGKLLELYGMTESTGLFFGNPSKGTKKLGSIGLPLLNVDVKMVNPETGEEVPIGEPGEICCKGPMVMREYLNKPGETKNSIDKDGYMHTGDVGIMEKDGYTRIVDRTKDMIIVSGFKVFSTKLEDVMSNHPAIGMSAAIGVADPSKPGSEIVHLHVEIDADYAYDGNEEALKQSIIDFAKEKCSAYEVPKVIHIIKELPLTTVGKVDKKAMRVKK